MSMAKRNVIGVINDKAAQSVGSVGDVTWSNPAKFINGISFDGTLYTLEPGHTYSVRVFIIGSVSGNATFAIVDAANSVLATGANTNTKVSPSYLTLVITTLVQTQIKVRKIGGVTTTIQSISNIEIQVLDGE